MKINKLTKKKKEHKVLYEMIIQRKKNHMSTFNSRFRDQTDLYLMTLKKKSSDE